MNPCAYLGYAHNATTPGSEWQDEHADWSIVRTTGFLSVALEATTAFFFYLLCWESKNS